MEFDIIFVLGLLVVAFGIPSFAGAYAEKRRPTRAIVVFLIGGAMIYYAIIMNPGAYSLATIDDTILTVIGRFLNE
ncbi:hypothetical protein [Yoonia sp. BS5-3]|uniref:50S ribosomal protein L35 n=1 Tax=Yoonia phaeophyticola TaxID=3137369 RepID=A0ABZ2V7J3_9RHOB